MKKVSVVGLGYVGLPLALLSRERGYDVTGIEINKDRAKMISAGISPINEKDLIKRLRDEPLLTESDFSSISSSDIVIICVPTPVKNAHEPDLTPLSNAVESVAKDLRKNALVIIESTVNPGVCDDLVIPTIERISGMVAGEDFYIAHCPERINPGDKKYTVKNINRVVGASSEQGLDKAVSFYESIIDAEIKPMNGLKEAEAVKIVENSFRDINIAFVNELAMSFQRMGIDIENVIDGAATKPFAFMAHRPGCGVGGHCIPVDPYYLIEHARSSFDFDHQFLKLARKINEGMPEYTVELLRDLLNEKGRALNGSSVGLLGLSYKADVDDDRESPAYVIQSILQKSGANVITYDPFIPQNSSASSLAHILEEADSIIIATNHSEFRDINSSLLEKNNIEVIIDGKNMLRSKKEGFIDSGILYKGIGIN